MKNNTTNADGLDPRQLFWASCMALIATSCSFAVFSDIMGPLKDDFALTNQDVGWIGGAQLWGFPLTILIFGPLCDVVGMRFLFRLAFILHLAGCVLMFIATGFWMLFAGALIIGMANGLVEAAGNPLVATLYPNEKTKKLNQFHVWFPGGIVIGSVLGYLQSEVLQIGTWHWKLAFILVPTLIYGLMFVGRRFPATERAQSGISAGDMFRATLTRPFFILLALCMMMTASVELGPNRWMGAVFTDEIPGIIVLAWISIIMAVLRQFCGPVVHKLSPTGILLASAMISGVGLWWLSFAQTAFIAFASSAVFAVGVCYFWPTMLGVVAERVPRGGALALAVLGGLGAFTAGFITAPVMGRIGDELGHDKLDPAKTKVVLEAVVVEYPAIAEQAEGGTGDDVLVAVDMAKQVLAAFESEGVLPPIQTANALRKAIDESRGSSIKDDAAELLKPADNYGGRVSFRYVSTLSIALTMIFGLMFLRDRMAGGYQVEEIGKGS
jgi:MFS family permease